MGLESSYFIGVVSVGGVSSILCQNAGVLG